MPTWTCALETRLTVTVAKISVVSSTGSLTPVSVRLVGEFTVRPVKEIGVALSDCRSATVVSPDFVEKPVPAISSVV